MVKNAANEGQVKKAGEKVQSVREIELNDIRGILNTKSGRRFFARYLEETGVFKTSFTGSSETFFREGERNIGLKMLADMNEAAPDAYALMINEAKGDEKNG